MSERTSQQWVEYVYEKLVVTARLPKPDDQHAADCNLCLEVVGAIADGRIKGWTTVQKLCTLIAKARKA